MLNSFSPYAMYPMMPGYGSMGNGMSPQKPTVVVHDGDATAQRRRLSLLSIHSVDVTVRRSSPRLQAISRCTVLEEASAEICLLYDVHAMRFSVDIKRAVRKIWRDTPREFALRETIPWIPLSRQPSEEKNAKNVFAGNLVSLSPRVGSLGYAVAKYDALRWHAVTAQPSEFQAYAEHEYGQFDALRGFVRYANAFEEQWTVDDMERGEVCGAQLDGLPFVMCVERGVVRFVKVDEEKVEGGVRGWSRETKESVDAELEAVSLDVEGVEGWDEVNSIYVGDEVIGVEKCVYLSTMQMCAKKEVDVVTLSVKRPLAHKPK